MVENNRQRWAHILPQLEKEKFLLLHHKKLTNVATHSHLFFELTYVLEGEVEHSINGKTSILRPGDYLLVDLGSVHSYHAVGDSFGNFDCVFLPALLDPSLKDSHSLRDVFGHYLVNFNPLLLSQDPAQMVFHDHSGSILRILEEIRTEWDEKQAGYKEMVRSHLIRILLLTLRRLEDAAFASGGQKISAYLTGFVTAHYSENIRLTQLARKMGYSLPYVSKCFREEMGMSFVDYLQNYRIRQACRLLLSKKVSLDEVAEAVGYGDVKFFSSLFKSIVGVPPAAYRKRNREL